MVKQTKALLSDSELIELETLAVELATWAGTEASQALNLEPEIKYKPRGPHRRPRAQDDPGDPVSAIDTNIETEVRRRISQRFPTHTLLGEEAEELPNPDADWVWVIDPIDGTSNFINRFPLFAVSIGLLHQGIPVVGAIWCSTTHLTGSGVYHARSGSALRLNGQVLSAPPSQVKRRLGAAPGGSPGNTPYWDNRVTGSAAFELAMVSAKVFTSVPLWSLSIWDVAAGVCLAWSANLEVWIRRDGEWVEFERFDPALNGVGKSTSKELSLRHWRSPLIVGNSQACKYWVARAGKVLGLRGRVSRRLRRFLSV